MFDFFRYIVDEYSGIDTEAAYKEKRDRKELQNKIEKKNRIIFSTKAKKITISFSCFYVVISVLMLILLKSIMSIFYVVLSIVKMMLAVGTIVALLIGRKKGEITAIVLILIFFLCLFISNSLVIK